MSKNSEPKNGKQCGDKEIAALSVGLIAATQLLSNTTKLTTGWYMDKAVRYLEDNWGIIHTNSALNTLEYIKCEGERTVYNILLPSFLAADDKNERKNILKQKFIAVNRLIQYSDNLSDCLSSLQENNAVSIDISDLKKGILAWDMAQMILIARLAFDAYYLTEKEAWKYINYAYENCRNEFGSWEEIGKSCLIGEALSNGNTPVFKENLDIFSTIMMENDSLWKKIKFG